MWHEEVHEGPELHEAVLERRARQQQATLAGEVQQRLPALRLEVLNVLSLNEEGKKTFIMVNRGFSDM